MPMNWVRSGLSRMAVSMRPNGECTMRRMAAIDSAAKISVR